MKVTATVQTIIFEASKTGFKVASILIDGEEYKIKGIMPKLLEGFTYEFDLMEDEHPSYGFQFRVNSLKVADPSDISDVENFLSSGAFKGIGPSVARKIVKHFGDDTMNVLKEDISRLTEVSGIGEKTLERIKESVAEHLEASDTLYELNKYGFSLSQSKKIYDVYGEDSIEVVKENPYRVLFDVKRIGFKIIDSLALKNGFDTNSFERTEALILYTVQRIIYGEGHLYVEIGELYDKIRDRVNLDDDVLNEAIETLTVDYHILHLERLDSGLRELARVYLSESYEWERGIVDQLIRLSLSFHRSSKLSDMVPSVELSKEQIEALDSAFDEFLFILTGAAGSGKTTIMKELIDRAENAGLKTVVAAPTGRAASRIEEVSGVPASTIHRLLEYEYDEDDSILYFNKNEADPLDADVIFIDEASMIDAQLFYSLLKAIRGGANLILVGDPNQLPPVGPGNPFADIMKSGVFNVKRLRGIHRQSGEGHILKNAYSILSGGEFTYNQKDGDFFHFAEYGSERAINRIVELVSSRIPRVFGYEPLESICVISPIKSGALGVENLNRVLQKALNPLAGHLYFNKYAPGDKVMQIKNNYNIEWTNFDTGEDGLGVFNGEIGFVEMASTDFITVKFLDGKVIEYRGLAVSELELAYAMTVHKAQGNEFDVVVFPSFFVPPVMRSKNLMYTAVTRAKKLFVLVGDKRNFESASTVENIIIRNSGLTEKICGVWDAE